MLVSPTKTGKTTKSHSSAIDGSDNSNATTLPAKNIVINIRQGAGTNSAIVRIALVFPRQEVVSPLLIIVSPSLAHWWRVDGTI
ncbi:hypothetical protein V493_08407 [Pseudogymnoascus sp. VKM F-4281 (FW-2241)]|nr:hypothetical protein V493_08407 [Pseudogymnoascus sp. VKM F-4281 (FW-2241)]